jgi:hypothetical protein
VFTTKHPRFFHDLLSIATSDAKVAHEVLMRECLESSRNYCDDETKSIIVMVENHSPMTCILAVYGRMSLPCWALIEST